jgi:hypothetical protein
MHCIIVDWTIQLIQFECPQFKTDFIIINTILSNVFTGLISNGFDDYYEKYEINKMI